MTPHRSPRPESAERDLLSVSWLRLGKGRWSRVGGRLSGVGAGERAGFGFDEEEAFAAQVLGCVAEWPEFDPAILNPQGGAIALGHPPPLSASLERGDPHGASGARLAGTLAHQLSRRGSGVGVATLCIGVGQGLALVLER